MKLIFFFLLLSNFSLCQLDSIKDINQLINVVNKEKNDTSKINIVNLVLNDSFFKIQSTKKEYNKTYSFFLDIDELSKTINYKKFGTSSILSKFHYFISQNEDSSCFYQQKALKYASNNNELKQGYLFLAKIYKEKNIDSAIYYFESCINISKDLYSALEVKNQLAILYFSHHKIDKAKYLFKNMIKEVESIPIKDEYTYQKMIDFNFSLADIYSTYNDSNTYYYEKAFKILKNHLPINSNNIDKNHHLYFSLCQNYIYKKRYNEAEQLIIEYEKINVKFGKLDMISNYLNELNGLLHIIYERNDSALKCYERVLLFLDTSSSVNFNESARNSSRLGVVYKLLYLNLLQSDNPNAVNLLYDFDSINRWKLKLANSPKIEESLTEFENKFQKSELKALALENNLAKKQIEIRNYWVGFILFISIIVFFLLFVILSRKKIKTENIKLKTKNNLLQSTISPHFIANSLTSLQGVIINKGANYASDLIGEFGSVMRKFFEFSQKEKITILEEIVFLKDYISYQKLQIPNLKIDFVCDIESQNLLFIPPMIFQPVIENAIKFASKLEDDHEIIIKVLKSANKIKLQTINKGKLKKIEEKFTSTIVIKERLSVLEKLYNDNFNFLIEEKNDLIFVTLEIPYDEIIDM